MSTANKTSVQLYIAVMLAIVGCGLLVAGFIVSPTGEIHESVLVGFGETMTFVAAILGVDYHYKSIIGMTKDNSEKEETKKDGSNS